MVTVITFDFTMSFPIQKEVDRRVSGNGSKDGNELNVAAGTSNRPLHYLTAIKFAVVPCA